MTSIDYETFDLNLEKSIRLEKQKKRQAPDESSLLDVSFISFVLDKVLGLLELFISVT
jgi:hypothetical protein